MGYGTLNTKLKTQIIKDKSQNSKDKLKRQNTKDKTRPSPKDKTQNSAQKSKPRSNDSVLRIGKLPYFLVPPLHLCFYCHFSSTAGDFVKFNFPQAVSTSFLAWGFNQWTPAYHAAGQYNTMLDSIRWPLDYFLKCWTTTPGTLYAQVRCFIWNSNVQSFLSLFLPT